MFSRFSKTLLALTSLAPVLAATGVNVWSRTGSIVDAIPWFAVTLGLAVIGALLLWFASKNLERQTVGMTSVEPADKEVLAFLVAYLLPLVAQPTSGFAGDVVTATFIFLMLVIIVYHGNAFTFNPLLSMMGYHFYMCRNKNEFPFMLISRHDFVAPNSGLRAVRLGPYIFLEVPNAK